jgi:hypothetical protein
MEPRKKKKPGQTDPGFQEEKPNKLLLLGLPAAAFVQKIFIFFHVETIPPACFWSLNRAVQPPALPATWVETFCNHLITKRLSKVRGHFSSRQSGRKFLLTSSGFAIIDNANFKQNLGERNVMLHAH